VRPRSRWYTDELTRTSTARLKVELGPKRWRETPIVHLESDGFAAEVRLVDVPCGTTHGGTRRFMICPSCGAERCTTLAVIPGSGWRCRACGGWRGRERRLNGSITGSEDRIGDNAAGRVTA
jgi:hypothetical protein